MDIIRLSRPERLALIAQFWDSLEQHQLPLSRAQSAELDRSVAALDQDTRQGVTWAVSKAGPEQHCPQH